MKIITRPYTTKIYFKDIPQGAQFRYDIGIYMKTQPVNGSNTVNLSNGAMTISAENMEIYDVNTMILTDYPIDETYQ